MYSAQTRSTLAGRRPAQLASSDSLAAARKLPLTSMPAKRVPAGPSRASSALSRIDVFAALPQPSSATTLPVRGTNIHRAVAYTALAAGHEPLSMYWLSSRC